MPTATSTIILGVVSGILTSAFLFILVQLFQRIVLPWYQALVYRGIDVSGRWISESAISAEVTQTVSADVRQNAHKLRGTVSVSKIRSSGTELVSLQVVGEIRDRLISLKVYSNDRKRFALSSLLLEVYGAGNVMRGVDSWYDSGSGRIASQNVVWHRKQT